MTGGHNKTGIADHIAMKFAANIPYIMWSLCSKVGDNSFIFKEVTTKRSMDPSSRVEGTWMFKHNGLCSPHSTGLQAA